jgi:sugar (pentulose or hexulose) kinase
MTLPHRIAVIDIGKTNAKVVLIRDGEQVAVRSTPNTVRTDGLYPHADVERLWGFIRDSLASLGAEHGIDGISITTHGATAALLSGDALAMPVLDYEHTGPEGTAAEYGAARPDFAETLSPRLPNGLNLGAQIFWQSRRFPDVFATVSDILPYPQYWAWRLTGVKASEVTSLGCHADLWAPNEGRLSSLPESEGWSRLFPPVVPAASVLGTLRPELAAELGLEAATPVTCGIHDSNASLIPHLGAHATPFTIVSSGTWTITMTVGGPTDRLDPARDSLANVDAFGRPVPTARFMGGREFDLLAPGAVEATADEIAKVITGDVQVLPGFVPGVGPFPSRAGAWTVATESLSAGERTAATSLYLALVTEAAIGLCGKGRSVTIEGPLARNRLYASAVAQLLEVPVFASGDATGTSLGAAMLFDPKAGAAHPGAPVEPLAVDGFASYAARWRDRVH